MRFVENINRGWFFAKTEELPTTLPTEWETVNLPHTWNATDGQDGGNDYFRGTGVYAKTVLKSELPEGALYYLELCGANSSADVYLNGNKVGHHDGGYSTWRVNLTEGLQDENLLVVAVDNAPNEHVYPQMADFTFYGGLYRDVNIIAVPETHFDLDYFGTPGLKVTPTVDGANAKVEVEVYHTPLAEGQKLVYTFYAAENEEIGKIETTDSRVVFDIENVHLWHGRRDPYLYFVEVEIAEGVILTLKPKKERGNDKYGQKIIAYNKPAFGKNEKKRDVWQDSVTAQRRRLGGRYGVYRVQRPRN